MASPEPPSPERRRRGLGAAMRRRLLRSRGRPSEAPAQVGVDKDIVIGALLAMLMLLGALAGLTLYQQGRIADQQTSITTAQHRISANQRRLDGQQEMLTFLERRDRINSYQTAYRFCTRINVDRAVTHDFWSYELPTISRARFQPRVRRFIRSYLNRLEDRGGMPILDCEPNVRGEAAKYIGQREQRAYVRRWRRYQLSPAELGICKIPIGTLTDPRKCVN